MKRVAFTFNAPFFDNKPLLIITMSQEGAIKAFCEYLTGFYEKDVMKVNIIFWMGKGTVSSIPGSGAEYYQGNSCLLKENIKLFEVLTSGVVCGECGRETI